MQESQKIWKFELQHGTIRFNDSKSLHILNFYPFNVLNLVFEHHHHSSVGLIADQGCNVHRFESRLGITKPSMSESVPVLPVDVLTQCLHVLMHRAPSIVLLFINHWHCLQWPAQKYRSGFELLCQLLCECTWLWERMVWGGTCVAASCISF